MDIEQGTTPVVEPDAVARYRRDGYLVVRRVLSRDPVEECLSALEALATDAKLVQGLRGDGGAFISLEPGADNSVGAERRANVIRKFGDFIDTAPALLRAAMSARLHAALDALMDQGRVLLQEMALVKPPRVSGEKPWHQDAAYFRGSDPT
jgi:phytanoyl-CoA hydroxylase